MDERNASTLTALLLSCRREDITDIENVGYLMVINTERKDEAGCREAGAMVRA